MGDRQDAINMLDHMRHMGMDDAKLVEEIVYHYMSGSDAKEMLESIASDYDL